MTRITLVHWNEAEAQQKAQALAQAGFAVDTYCHQDRERMLAIRDCPPEAFVIDLSRLPSQGIDFSVWLRRQKNTRRAPILFTGGSPEKAGRAIEVLPDAAYAAWSEIAPALRAALEQPLTDPLVPGAFDRYAGAPLAKKLGLRDGSRVMLVHAPAGFEALLEPLPDGCRLEHSPGTGPAEIVLLFAQSQAGLEQDFAPAAGALSPGGRLWIAWPKKASGIASDLSERSVRAFGLESGFVDYKISAFDSTWSGLCFARRQPKA